MQRRNGLKGSPDRGESLLHQDRTAHSVWVELLALLATACVWQHAGWFGPTSGRWGAFGAVTAASAASLLVQRPPRVRILFVGFVVLSAVGLFRSWFQWDQAALGVAVAALLAGTPWMRLVGISAVLQSAMDGVDGLVWVTNLTREGSALIGWTSEGVGPSALGVWPLLASILFVLSGRPRSRAIRRWTIVAALLLAWFTCNHVQFLAIEDGPGGAGVATGQLPLLMACFLGAAVLGSGASRFALRPPILIAALLVVSTPLCAQLHRGLTTQPSLKGKSVLFFNEGGLDWARPQFGRYGTFSSGMFGFWPLILEQCGATTGTTRTTLDLVDPATRPDLFVVINCDRVWSADDRSRIDSYLREGGACLVLGDHTDVFGCQRGLNSLLSGYGCSMRFDSAYHAASSWEGCMRIQETGAPIRCERFVASHGIGASLDCTTRWTPILVGRHAFSDHGIRENVRGAFLGNYHWDPIETYGDLTVAAWRAVSDGRLVVYGDTGAFQNATTPQARQHLLPTMVWAMEPVTPLDALPPWVGGSLLLLASTALVLTGRVRWTLAVLVAQLAFGRPLGAMVPDVPRDFGSMPVALVDRSIAPITGFFQEHVNSTGALTKQLQRMGFDVRYERDGLSVRNPAPKLLVMVAPGAALSEAKCARLDEYLRKGGVALAFVGGESGDGLNSFLAERGLHVGSHPLGRLQTRNDRGVDGEQPRTRSAWPLRIRSHVDLPAWTESLVIGDETVAATARIGDGVLIVVGDPTFMSDTNSEGGWGYWPGNMIAMVNLLRPHIPFDLTQPERFPSPTKPE